MFQLSILGDSYRIRPMCCMSHEIRVSEFEEILRVCDLVMGDTVPEGIGDINMTHREFLDMYYNGRK